MRGLRLLALVAPSLLLLPAVACEDPSSPSQGNITFEAGPGFEAGPSPEAAPPPEAGPDTAPAPKGVAVTVLEGGLPKASVRVLSHDATGAITGESKTDATGLAVLATAPSMVTVLTSRSSITGPGGAAPITYYGVEDGDHLTVTLPPSGAQMGSPVVSHYAVTITAPVAGTTLYDVAVNGGSCANNANNQDSVIDVPLNDTCLRAQNVVLAQSRDNGFVSTGFDFVKNAAKPAVGTSLPLSFTLKPPVTAAFRVTNVPQTAGLAFQRFFSIVGDLTFEASTGTGTITDPAGVAIPFASGLADAYQSYVTFRPSSVSGPEKGIFRREAVTATPPPFDFTTTLPFVTTSDATGVGRPDVTVTADASLATTDGGVLLLVWQDSMNAEATWTFVVPPGGAPFKVPALPIDATAFVPTPGAFIDTATFVESTLLTGYKALRALPLAPVDVVPIDQFLDSSKPIPKPDTIRFTTWSSNRRG